MVQLENGAGWRWLTPWRSMADLAEAVDDLICSFDYMDTAMDNLALLVFLWIVASLLVLAAVRWAKSRFYDKSSAPQSESKPPEVAKSTASEIINSVDSVLATSAKIKASTISNAPKKTVPATPPNKKRLRMSPGPDSAATRRAHSLVVPSATGADPAAVQWVNDLFLWLYNDLVIVNELIQQWIHSMNDFSKKSVEEQGIGVELVRALDSHPPTLTNLYCECDSKDDVTITCDCEATPAFQLKSFRQSGEKVDVSHYRVNVNRFRARLCITCITDKLTGSIQCDGWPEVKVALAQVGAIRANNDERDLQKLISEVIVSALRNTRLDVNLSQYPTCPRLRRHYHNPGPTLPLHYDSMLNSEQRTSSQYSVSHAGGSPQLLGGDKRLLVKVVGAKDLGGKEGCVAPYCVVEMDEPPQRNQTAVKKDTSSPVWDEHFLFELCPSTAELLFEIYDRTGPVSPGGTHSHRFLGLGIVGIDELLVSLSQRQLIGLQGRPMEEQDITGVLTVEFLFIEGAEVPDTGVRPYKLKETLRTVSPSGQTLTTTKTSFHQQNGHNNTKLAESALRELELSPASTVNKSTLIIHSVQREPKRSIKVELTDSGKFIELESLAEDAHAQSEQPVTSTPHQSPKCVRIVDAKQNGDTINENGDAPGDYVNNTASESADSVPEPAPRKKRRDFFSTIKRRLGRSRTRGRPELAESEEEGRVRSISAERTRNGVSSESALAVPNRAAYSAGASPVQSGDESRTSRRSSFSEVSGFSTASARTFIHEASTLVLETLEAGIKKHYLVPLAVAQRSRWRRKGVKLHIYNEHTFIAKHLSGGTVCEVCGKNVARRMGKQGYECRDCLLKCHKQCHVKVQTNCPHSTVHNMELVPAKRTSILAAILSRKTITAAPAT